MHIIEELKKRGCFSNITSEKKMLNLKPGNKVYAGFDPTAKSLHLGNYVQIMNLKRFKEHGFEVVAVLGGATGMIGDPSFKKTERSLQSKKENEKNKIAIKKQLEFFGFKVFDNFEIYKDMKILDFLREVGKQLNIAYMINKESVKTRINSGLSFTEFAYQLIQGWDFKYLYDEGVFIQLGGSDQWGNITSGIEIIKKEYGVENKAVGITTNLLITSNGEKFGKTEGNALFLDEKMTPAFVIYQYLFNSTDTEVEKYLKWISSFKLEKIKNIMKKHLEEPKNRIAQKELAFNIISNIFSIEKAEKCRNIANKLFKDEIISLTNDEIKEMVNAIPTFKFQNQKKILDLLFDFGIIKTKKRGKDLIKQGAIYIDGKKIDNPETNVVELFLKENMIIKRGKKNYYLIIK